MSRMYQPEAYPKPSLNMEKYKQILHYIIDSVGARENIGKTTIYKILYFCDFDYYEKYEKPLTGESYRKINRGPAPCNFNRVVSRLKKEGAIKIKEANYRGYSQQKFISLKKPQTTLSNPELELIDEAIRKLSNKNATQISNFSHKDLPYRATPDKKIIDYRLVFYRTPEFSVRTYPD